MKAPTDTENQRIRLRAKHPSMKEPVHATVKEADARVQKSAGAALQNRRGSLHIALMILAVVAIVYALHAGTEIALPLALALVLKLMFQPTVDFLGDRLRLPQLIGALAVVISLLALTGGLAFAVSGPASSWLQKMPDVVPAAKTKLEWLRQPIDYLQKGFKEVQEVATPNDSAGTTPVTVKQPSAIGSSLAWGTATSLARFVTTLVMLFFLLASGDRLLRAFIEVLPRFEDKRQTVEIANEIHRQIGGYLLTITMMNSLVGVAAALAMWASGLGDPVLWGVSAFLLNFIPIIGPLVGIGVLLLAGIVALEWPWHALLPAFLYLLIHVSEGDGITPMLLAKRFTLNPVLVIVSLFLWYAVWGIPGALLAVPILAVAKIVCDRIEPLHPIGHIIGA